MAAAAQLPEQQRQALEAAIETMQVKDSLKMYNNLVDRCFRDCVDSFRRKDLDSGEEKCVQKCCEKFLRHSQRVGARFAELSQATEAQMANLMQQQGK
ncbi:protein transporter tim9 [Prototheca wickerhamii]|uniref:Mitochondrial import inner membrane translocase subunit n=1 Tax=Prototheca wickerhamii TaxID=3111 RepID=A0AAD9ILL4_PROWI|nr:protein transporter tim9 [Prototheca wickerhamii]